MSDLASRTEVVRTFKLSQAVTLAELLKELPDLPLENEEAVLDYIDDEWSDHEFQHAVSILQHHLEHMDDMEEWFYENFVQRIDTPRNFQWPIDPTDPASESIKLYESLVVDGKFPDKKSADRSCKVLLEWFPDVVSVVGMDD